MNDKIRLEDDKIRKAYYQLSDAVYNLKEVVSNNKRISKDQVIPHNVMCLENLRDLLKERLDERYLWD